MDQTVIYAIKSGFSWLVVALSIAGYAVTWKRTHERWVLWIVLAVGWIFLAVPNTLLLAGANLQNGQLVTVWLSSFVMVFTTLLLLFLKLIEMAKRRKTL